MMRSLVIVLLISIAAMPASKAGAEPERTVEIETRPGIHVRALLSTPRPAAGSVILLAGGDGHLRLTLSGEIGWGARNQLVRTRARYAAAGYATLVPDVAPDLIEGETFHKYRSSGAHSQDIGALIAYMRRLAQPVFLVGTSRAAISVLNAAVRNGAQADVGPDGLVITSGMLNDPDEPPSQLDRKSKLLATIWQPTLLVVHEDDACPYTPAAEAFKFRSLLMAAQQVLVMKLNGGDPGDGDPCEANSHHGFLGQDEQVVSAVVQWLHTLNK